MVYCWETIYVVSSLHFLLVATIQQQSQSSIVSQEPHIYGILWDFVGTPTLYPHSFVLMKHTIFSKQ